MSETRIYPGFIYQHYKGPYYYVLHVGTHTETHEAMVVYHPIDDPTKIWIRPLNEFIGKVETEEAFFPIPRFRKLGPPYRLGG